MYGASQAKIPLTLSLSLSLAPPLSFTLSTHDFVTAKYIRVALVIRDKPLAVNQHKTACNNNAELLN